MLLVAAIGILVLTMTDGGRGSGIALLVATGMIVLIAGAVIIYAAVTGKRPGWFLPFTIVGAVIAVPVTITGAALGVINEPYYSAPEEAYGSTDLGYEDYEEWSAPYAIDGPSAEIRRLDPNEDDIWGQEERLLLDLTDVPEGTKLDFDVELRDSQLFILLDSTQLPIVDSYLTDGPYPFEAVSPTDFNTDGQYGLQSRLSQWVDQGMPREGFPGDLGDNATGPSAVFKFNFDVEGAWSLVRFVVTESPTTDLDAPQSGAQSAQSGASTNDNGGN